MKSPVMTLRGLLLPALVLATSLAPVVPLSAADMPTSTGNGGLAIGKPHAYADVYLDTDRFNGTFTLDIRAEDVGKTGELFLAAWLNDRLYLHNGSDWLPWDGRLTSLQPAATRTLSARETLTVLDDDRLPAGEFTVYAAYRAAGGDLVMIRDTLAFQVKSARRDTLQRFSSADAMSDYIKQGMRNGTYNNLPYVTLALAETSASDSSTAAAPGANNRVSTTNLQEVGVDEADSIKTDGRNLFVLNNCDFQACLDVYDLDAGQASAAQLASFNLGNEIGPDGMYLVQDRPGSDLLVTVAGQNGYAIWADVWGWSGNSTEIEFFNADQPDNLVSLEKLTFDGSLVSSRRVGDTLYVVTRYTPFVEGFYPYAFDEETQENNDTLLAGTPDDSLLPRVTDSRDQVLDLIQAESCYLPVSAVDQSRNPSIISITSIPLSDPAAYESVCFLGGSETLYMTPDSLYLATTQWDYNIVGFDAIVYDPRHTTAVHKFALTGGAIEYRGSGQVKGHLGWAEDKKSFRMGEHDGYLNIVTSVGDTWNDSSSTQLAVLKESSFGDELETVRVIEGIGKPGEQLYAARFIGDRAYLVTFRLIDPLYVVDLSDQENPVITGELEIDGYSDYLHPVTETLLLGIGKDAIPDDGSFDFGGGRGAWYQGVKLSLFNVADPANPREIDSVILGKRGTESAVLWDHHALSFLPGNAGEPARLSIPVQLHDTTPTWEFFDANEPSAWYDHTHTALYSFELSELGISQAGRIISETGSQERYFIAVDNGGVTDDEGGVDPDREPGAAEDGEDSGMGGATPGTEPELLGDSENGDRGETDPAEPEKPAEGDEPVDLPDARLIFPIYTWYADRSVLLDDAVFYIHNGEVFSAYWGEDRDYSEAQE